MISLVNRILAAVTTLLTNLTGTDARIMQVQAAQAATDKRIVQLQTGTDTHLLDVITQIAALSRDQQAGFAAAGQNSDLTQTMLLGAMQQIGKLSADQQAAFAAQTEALSRIQQELDAIKTAVTPGPAVTFEFHLGDQVPQ